MNSDSSRRQEQGGPQRGTRRENQPTSGVDADRFGSISARTEPSRATYIWRRLGVAVLLAAICVLGITAGTGSFTARSGAIDNAATGPLEASQTPSPTPIPSSPTAGLPSATQTSSNTPPVDESPVQEVVGLPTRASRLIAQQPQRVLDTRDGEQPAPETVHNIDIPPGKVAVAVSVSIMNSSGPGAVVVDGGAGNIEAVKVGNVATTATNLVVVPVVKDQLTVRSTAGGHLTVDLVGTFEASTGSAAGRFVAIEPTSIARLETAIDGREASLPFLEATSSIDATAFLVVVSADVGADGGMVRLGQTASEFNQMLMWGPAIDGNRQRRGLVLIQPGADLSGYLRYDGGSVLTADVIGYFTGEQAEVATNGLYVPLGPRRIFDGLLEPETPAVVEAIEPGDGDGLVVVSSGSVGSGQLGTFVVPVVDGSVTLRSTAPLDAEATLLGLFLP